MTMRPRAFPFALALVVALPDPAAARTINDTQLWPDLLVIAPLGRGVLASAEAINRTVDDIGREGQIETRLQIGHSLSPKLTAWIGWVHFTTYAAAGVNGIENHAVEQLNWNPGKIGAVPVALRTRLEQRAIRGIGETSWRVREQARFTLPLRAHGPALVGWTEPFVALNRTRAQPYLLERLRSFAGINVPISPHLAVEAGYLNEYIPRPTGKRDNHALNLIANVRL